jgi:hypothetical protein
MHVVAGACTAVVNAMQGTTGGMGSDDRSIQFQWMDTRIILAPTLASWSTIYQLGTYTTQKAIVAS